MAEDRNSIDPAPRPPRRLIWIVGGAIIAILVLLALNGLLRGGGEASGITEAAPGDDNAAPAPETKSNRGE